MSVNKLSNFSFRSVLAVPIHVEIAALKSGLYGGQDTGIPLDSVEQTRQQLQTGQSGSSIIVYPDAPHAFLADYRPNYRQKDAQDGWKRLQAWFKAKGVTTI